MLISISWKGKPKSSLLLIKKIQSKIFKRKNVMIGRCEVEGNKVTRASAQG